MDALEKAAISVAAQAEHGRINHSAALQDVYGTARKLGYSLVDIESVMAQARIADVILKNLKRRKGAESYRKALYELIEAAASYK
jgi:hypothetical protein